MRVVATVLGSDEDGFGKSAQQDLLMRLAEQRIARAGDDQRSGPHLLPGLHGLAAPRDADDIAFGVTALIDGLWLRLGLQPGSVSREQAILQVKSYVAGRLATRETVTAVA